MRRHFDVVPRRPYSLERTCVRLARFPERVDRFEAGVYRRLLDVDDGPALMTVRQLGPPSRAVLRVAIEGERVRLRSARAAAEHVLARVVGTSVDVRPFYRRFAADPLLGPLIKTHYGLRVAGRETLWHTLVQIVLSQQINLTLAHDMLCDLVRHYGRAQTVSGERFHAFPSTRRFARLSVASLRERRLSRAKAETLIGLARAFESGELSDDALDGLDDDAAVERLTSFKGVGRWTAEFTLLRGLARMDVFPGGDLGVVKHLARRMLGRKSPASEDEMRRFAEGWRPYRGLALIYAYAELG